MLYNIILALLIPIIGLLVFFSYRQGLKDGQILKEDKPLKPVIEPKHKKIEQDRELKRRMAILENINVYNGSSAGQRDVR